jgi:hypothetical protein
MKQLLIIFISTMLFAGNIFAKEKYDFKHTGKLSEKIELLIDGKMKKVKVSSKYTVWANKGDECAKKRYSKSYYKKEIIVEQIISEAECINVPGYNRPLSKPKLSLVYMYPGAVKYNVGTYMFDTDGISFNETDGIQFLQISIQTGAKQNLSIERYNSSFFNKVMKNIAKSEGLSDEEINSIDFIADFDEVIFNDFVYGVNEVTYQTSMMQNYSTMRDIAFFTNRDETKFIDEIINKIEASKTNNYSYSLTETEINKIRDFEKMDIDAIAGFQPRN